jgi:hypothetical protein
VLIDITPIERNSCVVAHFPCGRPETLPTTYIIDGVKSRPRRMAKSRSDCPVLFSLSLFFSLSLSQSIAACLLGVPCYPRAAVAVPYVLLPLQYIPTKKFLLPCFVLAPLLLGLAGPSSNRLRAPHCNCAIAWTEYAIGAPALPGGARKGHLTHCPRWISCSFPTTQGHWAGVGTVRRPAAYVG